MILYADYKFYVESYDGDLKEEEFQKVISRASSHVRRMTFGRADMYSDIEEVKLSVCAVCDVIAADMKNRKKHGGMNISSENTDGYSVSYVTDQVSGESADQALNRKIYTAAELYLEPTGLLNWGVYDDDEF